MRFTKMHGCGNDYIYVDAAKEMIEHPSDLAIRLSDRHFGIGSDGLILICPSGQADFRMRTAAGPKCAATVSAVSPNMFMTKG